MKRVRITLAQARKRLAAASRLQEEAVGIYGKAWLGRKVHALEAGMRTAKERAARNARRLVETMVARELTAVDRVVVRSRYKDEDPGFSAVYLAGSEAVLVVHSSVDRVGLGADRRAQLEAAGITFSD